MPMVDGNPANEDPFFSDYEFRVQADAGTQLRQFIVLDRMGMAVAVEPPLVPCETDYYECVARRIAASRFPLSVQVEDCDDNNYGPDEFPLFGVPPRYSDDRPGIAFPCSTVLRIENPPCERALADARRFRQEAVSRCIEVNSLRKEWRGLLVAAATATVAFVALFTAGAAAASSGGWFGAIAAILFWAAAAVFLTLSLHYTYLAARKFTELRAAEPYLRQAQGDFSRALAIVDERCCPSDVSINRQIPCGDVDVFGHSVLPSD